MNKYSLKLQNLLIVVASYIFYGWWDWRFLSLIVFSTIVDYSIGIALSKSEDEKRRKLLLWCSVFVNLGLLGFFKYYDFFLENFVTAFSFFGFNMSPNSLNIILPVGISFYTFQTMSYTIDVYKKKLTPTKDFIAFASFVSFFPQLVAGPIERAVNLLPQMEKKRSFSYDQAIDGIRLILFGLFKKVVIADNLAPSVNEIFANYETYNTPILMLGAVFFAFQIYCDFSGYSYIARGLAKMLGFELMVNFNFPYFSRSIAEFWRKWHISLSTWFRDYLYIPLGGSRGGMNKSIRNVFVIFLVSGFWHGANWTFIVWGGLHALLFVPSFVMKSNRNNLNDLEVNNFYLPSVRDFLNVLFTFVMVTLAWVFFRAESITIAFEYLGGIFSFNFESMDFLNPYDNQPLFKEFFYLGGLILAEYLIVTKSIELFSRNWINHIIVNALLIVMIIINSPINSKLSFIYFQF